MVRRGRGAESGVRVRTYRRTDASACERLFEELFETHRRLYADPTIGQGGSRRELRRHLKAAGPRSTFVASVEGQVVGFLGLRSHGGYGEVEPLVVTARMRGKGVAGLLLARAAKEGRRRHWRYLAIRPVARNVRAIRAFHASGFEFLAQLELDLRLERRGEKTLRRVPGPVIAGRRFTV